VYRVQLRYHIHAGRDQHVAQFDAMVRDLEKLGFEFDPPLEELPPTIREDPTVDVLSGLVPAANRLKLLNVPHVSGLLLMPPAFGPPAQADVPVAVQLELVSGYSPVRQRDLADQVRVLLQHFGFREAVGYDHRGYTGQAFSRLRGTIPAGRLEVLLRDLRRRPTGWFAPRLDPANLPTPLAAAPPIFIAEVLADPNPPTEPPEPLDRGDEDLDKITPDLWALVRQKDQASASVRLEIILAVEPVGNDTAWQHALTQAAPSLIIEGWLGPVVTGVAQVGEARALAALPLVSVVRLPRAPRVQVAAALGIKGDDALALRQTGLAAWHKRGLRGKGVRVAVIDSDFRGHEALVRAGRLPATTQLVDLTVFRNPSLLPDPLPEDGIKVGHGTHCALAVALAAPEAELTLVRIDPKTPYMLTEVLTRIRGVGAFSRSLEWRSDELRAQSARLRERRARLLEERRIVLENFEDEEENQELYGFLGPVRGWLMSVRTWNRARLHELERDDAAFRRQQLHFLRLLGGVEGLKGIDIVSCSLVWNEGMPLGSRSPLDRALDRALAEPIRGERAGLPPPLWLTPAGNTRGQVWEGLFQDPNADGVMGFSPPGAPLPEGVWDRTLAFLAWQPYAGPRRLDLPEKTRMRLTLQWTEPHDSDYFVRPGEPDRYLQPLALLRLSVLRQRDPEAKLLAADDFEVVARSWERPQRLANFPHSSTYEMAVEFTPVKGGRYALRLERHQGSQWILVPAGRGDRLEFRKLTDLVAGGVRPLGVATLPGLERQWQLRPRLFLEAMDGPAALLGRPVFQDFATDRGTVGVPADARRPIAVGASGPGGKAEPYSAPGPPPGIDLFVTPRVLAPDTLDLGLGGPGPAFGTGLATPLTAGAAAVLRGAGRSRAEVRQLLQCGGLHLLEMPAEPPKAR
jgi:hypothetical protein